MNFEFLQNLKGLSCIYKYCKNAEELALSKPYCSMFASRKSAEALANFIYLSAYKERAHDLSFSDILTDNVVKKYINDRYVLDAFHSIRKKGNSAVHGDDEKTIDQAMELLEDLHYVVGETAKNAKLISSYTHFRPDIEEYPEAEFYDFDAKKLAEDMFSECIAKYRAEKLFDEYIDFRSPFEWVPGDIDLNEYLEFKSKPTLRSTIPQIQSYFGYLAMKAIKYQYEDNHELKMTCSASLTIFGEEIKTTSTLFDFMESLMRDLPNADRFVIKSSYSGPCIAGLIDDETKVPFSDAWDINTSGKQEDVIYKLFEFYGNSGEDTSKKYENGAWVNLESHFTSDILDRDFGADWWCWNQDLYVEFNVDKYPDILIALREAVKRHIPEDQYKYCEGNWEYGENEILVSSISWYPRKLRVVQDFLDEINAILSPVKNECECHGLGNWHITKHLFAVATWDWFEDGFKVVGMEF